MNIYQLVAGKVFINNLGLFLDIVAGLLLFKFGLPENISRSGSQSLLLQGVDEKEKEKAKKYDYWARFGLILLIVGFVLQFVSGFLQD